MLDTLIVADTKGSESRDKDDNEDSDEDDNTENDTAEEEEKKDDCPDPKMKLSPITADWDRLDVIAFQCPPIRSLHHCPSDQSELATASWEGDGGMTRHY